jgi:hypothetical protein
MVLTGKSKYMKENLSHCHFVNTNPTWTDLGTNSVLLTEGDSYRLSRCTAEVMLTCARESNPYLFAEEAKDNPHNFADSVDSKVVEKPTASVIRTEEQSPMITAIALRTEGQGNRLEALKK